MDIKQQIIGLPSYQPGKPIEEVKEELGLTRVVKLASNENPYGASKRVATAISESATNTTIYPDGYSAKLREKVALKLGVTPEQLIFGNGSDEVIQFLCRALLSPGTNTVTADPTFSQYKLNATIEGAEVREVPSVDGVHHLEAMLQAIDEMTRIVWVCNPNNPSGTYVNEDTFKRFLDQVPPHVLVVSDEAYYEYVTAKDYPNTIPLIKKYPNLMVLRTFSKAYGLAALRIGYGVGSAGFVSSIDPVRPPFNNNSFAHCAAIAALEDQAFIDECVEKNTEGMKQFEQFCQKHELYYYPSQTNFILIDFKQSGDRVFDFLLRKGFIVRSGKALGFPTCVRITIGKKEDNEELFTYLEELVNHSTVQ
ncbi:histidinol-phosphate transaminase [Alkalihalobacillus hemicellulosilyticus]|uniref:Histidinol-phosphate aminotransferase n=1 Tax=Halalkalibacter hemicellulosilyticusJCM 9152 TaxID=1236971 RepID=W4QAF1_9BACI|nr:histidinol-phosphate transaminase [Halalkalibacter hemicellulosilyticus]GAE29026.1 biosynthetic aromatic amino acid aminotransferase beta [Halalkalibacter hemicellulosilyticusJCM 9152]